ncbi:P-loop containing nucleoside triphosphate hydrolase protein [Xylogone sp. PMI_703]|nr:P-loop containing nucleoside triphosphate hydrolase protein [Xylogone sp. PMI_703]KAH8809468.1 P-loop containing nucleoside triphosphate hydrolase protein [Xylogone sp. PMI_703]
MVLCHRQQSIPRRIKREHQVKADADQARGVHHKKAAQATSKAVQGIRAIYGPQGRFKSVEQQEAMEFMHHGHTTSIIVLPTSSGKSVLFFSMAATVVQQTVVVVVPFAALVDDIMERGREAGLNCEEWRDEHSGKELQQLIVVSADRAVNGPFLQYAQGMQIRGQLAHMFFDECHVAITDISYRARLRTLWQLRYIGCRFTGLTATLIVDLEWILREQLSIEGAVLFRRHTARRTIRYRVIDSKNEPPFEVGIRVVQQLGEFSGNQGGIIYVRSYAVGEKVQEILGCPFYKATAEDKGEMLQQWIRGEWRERKERSETEETEEGEEKQERGIEERRTRGQGKGWIVATGALGTGINIEGIRYVIHIDRPYGLTSFVQQSGRGGRSGEVSESIIVVNVKHTRPFKGEEEITAYSVEEVDEQAMTEYIQSRPCRRIVLGRYMDGVVRVDCGRVDGVLCDVCHKRAAQEQYIREEEGSKAEEDGGGEGREVRFEGETSESGIEREEEEGPRVEIRQRLGMEEMTDGEMFWVMGELQKRCIYCELTQEGEAKAEIHEYTDCELASRAGCGMVAYEQWREEVRLDVGQQCWECGLTQELCRRVERGLAECEYSMVMLVGIFIMMQQEAGWRRIGWDIGFRGQSRKEIVQWMGHQERGND